MIAEYLFKKKRWECKRLSTKVKVEDTFDDVTDKTNEKINLNFIFSNKQLKIWILLILINDRNYDREYDLQMFTKIISPFRFLAYFKINIIIMLY